MNGAVIGGEFVEGWQFVQTLGEGTYGEVKLAVSSATNEAVAVKILQLRDQSSEAVKSVKKEILIHRRLDHPNIIKFFGNREEGLVMYLFLEYARGGELFDRIEPDLGMHPALAQRYFGQLISAVDYLFGQGITHRDLKPENILLDDADNLKLTDFGMATMFKHKDSERKLAKCCGTLPYVAPEVLLGGEFYARPADIWSCGIILVAMLAGELPWDAPSDSNREYCDWKDRKIFLPPWSKLDNVALSMIRNILVEESEERYGIAEILKHRWMRLDLHSKKWDAGGVQINNNNKRRPPSPRDSPPLKRRRSGEDSSLSRDNSLDSSAWMAASQPDAVPAITDFGDVTDNGAGVEPELISFSQPATLDHMLISSQILGTQNSSQSSQTPIQRLVKRMTRFVVTAHLDEVAAELARVFGDLECVFKKNNAHTFTVSTVDRRKKPLVFKATLIELETKDFLCDFRLSKGDGLEFKKCFCKIKSKICPTIVKPYSFMM